jgi:hypothetical protein
MFGSIAEAVVVAFTSLLIGCSGLSLVADVTLYKVIQQERLEETTKDVPAASSQKRSAMDPLCTDIPSKIMLTMCV